MLILLCIYLIFIGLGLSDSLLGSAWPLMAQEFGVNVENAGILSFLISVGVIISSLNVWRLIRRWGTEKAAMFGLGLIAAALFGYSVCFSWWLLCFCSVFLGFGAGIIQTVFDNFVAEHYSARHMNWLQGSWGIGAVAAPYVVSLLGTRESGWRLSYQSIGLVEIVILILLVISLPGWKRYCGGCKEKEKAAVSGQGGGRFWKKLCMGAQFFLYCSMENTVMLWGASYLVYAKGFEPAKAAQGVSLFFLGITAGRFLSGFIADRLGNLRMVFLSVGIAVIMDGILLGAGSRPLVLAAFFLLGAGMAPVYPALLHQTPGYFPDEDLNFLMGVQVASAYVGITIIPPFLGKLFAVLSFQLLPVFQMLFLISVCFCVTYLCRGKERKL